MKQEQIISVLKKYIILPSQILRIADEIMSLSPQPSATAKVEAHTSCPICGRSFSAAADCKQPCQHCNDFMSAVKPVAEREENNKKDVSPDLCCGIYSLPEKITAGTLALCSMGALGMITSDTMMDVVYGDGNTGIAYIGMHLTDKIAPIGSRWSSRKPKVVGHISDIDWNSVIKLTKP